MSFKSFAVLDMKSGGQDSVSVDLSSSDQAITLTLSSVDGGERIYRDIRVSDGLIINENQCPNTEFAQNQTCNISLTVQQSTSLSGGSVVVKYIDAGVRKLEIFNISFIKTSGISLVPEFGVNNLGEVEFDELSLLQSAKKRVKITNRGNTASPIIGKLSGVNDSRSIKLIREDCAGKSLLPEQSCFLQLKVDSSKIFAGSFSYNIDFISEVDGSSLYTLPVKYSVGADRSFNNELANIDLIKNQGDLQRCLDNDAINNKMECFYGIGPSEPNLILNGTFDSDISGWSNLARASWESQSSRLDINAQSGSGARQAEYEFATQIGNEYRVTLDVDNNYNPSNAGGVAFIYTGANYSGDLVASETTSGTGLQQIDFSFVATSNSAFLVLSLSDNGDRALFDNVDVRDVSTKALDSANLVYSNLDCNNGMCFYSLEYALETAPLRLPVTLSFEDVNALSFRDNNLVANITNTGLVAGSASLGQIEINQDNNVSITISNDGSENIDFANFVKIVSNSPRLSLKDMGTCALTTLSAGQSCQVNFEINYNHFDNDGEILQYTVNVLGHDVVGTIDIDEVVGPPDTIEASLVGDAHPIIPPQSMILTVRDQNGTALRNKKIQADSSTDSIELTTDINGQASLGYYLSNDYFISQELKDTHLEVATEQLVSFQSQSAELDKNFIPTFRSCSEIRHIGPNADDLYNLDQDGDGPAAPVSVYCGMDDQDGWELSFVAINPNSTEMNRDFRDSSISSPLPQDPDVSSIAPISSAFTTTPAALKFSCTNNAGDPRHMTINDDEFVNRFWNQLEAPPSIAGNNETRNNCGGVYYCAFINATQSFGSYYDSGQKVGDGSQFYSQIRYDFNSTTTYNQFNVGVQVDGNLYSWGLGSSSQGVYYRCGTSTESAKNFRIWTKSQNSYIKPQSCQEVKLRDSGAQTGMYSLDVDGLGGEEAESVFCIFDGQSAMASSLSPTGSNEFYSDISNRFALPSLMGSLDVLYGVNELRMTALESLPSETSLLGEVSRPLPLDRLDRVRFMGSVSASGSNVPGGLGPHIRMEAGSSMEITFYGTDLNLVFLFDGGTRNLSYSVDGGPLSPNIYPDQGSGVLSSDGYASSQVLPLNLNLSLGTHTVRIYSSSINLVYGAQIINERDNFLINSGPLYVASQDNYVQRPSPVSHSFYRPPAGGRVVLYLDESGDVQQSATTVPGDHIQNLIMNGDFETNSLAPWVELVTPGFTTVVDQSGNKVLRSSSQPGSKGGVGQDIVIDAGSTYILEYKILSGSINNTEVAIIDNVNGVSDYIFTFESAGTYSKIFKANSNSYKIFVGSQDTGTTGDIFFDDIKVYQFPGKFLTNADHSNEEEIKTYNFRDFGAGSDFATLSSSVTNPSFTLEDGTSLNGAGVSAYTPNSDVDVLYSGVNGSVSITFTGTGLDVSMANFTSSPPISSDIYLNGFYIGRYQATSGGETSREKVKIASGLPYGTHTVVLKDAPGEQATIVNITDFHIYAPAKPAVPAGGVEIASYNAIAQYKASASTTQGVREISTGVLRKQGRKNFIYRNASWGQTVAPEYNVHGIYQRTLSAGGSVEYTFYGTGIEFLSSYGTSAPTISVELDNMPLGTQGSVRVNNGSYDEGTSSYLPSNYSNFQLTDLPLGLHTIRFTRTGGDVFVVLSMDVITPVDELKTFKRVELALPSSCKEIKEQDPESENGEYLIQPNKDENPYKVLCDMETDGGGWTLVSGHSGQSGTSYFWNNSPSYYQQKTSTGSFNDTSSDYVSLAMKDVKITEGLMVRNSSNGENIINPVISQQSLSLADWMNSFSGTGSVDLNGLDGSSGDSLFVHRVYGAQTQLSVDMTVPELSQFLGTSLSGQTDVSLFLFAYNRSTTADVWHQQAGPRVMLSGSGNGCSQLPSGWVFDQSHPTGDPDLCELQSSSQSILIWVK